MLVGFCPVVFPECCIPRVEGVYVGRFVLLSFLNAVFPDWRESMLVGFCPVVFPECCIPRVEGVHVGRFLSC